MPTVSNRGGPLKTPSKCEECGNTFYLHMYWCSQRPCECPEAWWEIVGPDMHDAECPEYDSCGGWTWDPPCGGCDHCLMAQYCYYDPDGSKRVFELYDSYRQSVKECA